MESKLVCRILVNRSLLQEPVGLLNLRHSAPASQNYLKDSICVSVSIWNWCLLFVPPIPHFPFSVKQTIVLSLTV